MSSNDLESAGADDPGKPRLEPPLWSTEPGQVAHIFRAAAGHLNPATEAEQTAWIQTFQGIASDPANLSVSRTITVETEAELSVRREPSDVTLRPGERTPGNLRDAARLFDERRDNVRCAEAYEALVSSGAATLSELVDLALVYWEASDYGVATARQIPIEFQEYARTRLQEILDDATRRQPDDREAKFWHMYCRSVFTVTWDTGAFRALLDSPDDRADGAFATMWRVVYGDESEIPTARSIMMSPHIRQTSKGRYIASVIVGVMRRRDGA